MSQEKDYLQDLTEIRSIMEKSTKFISLSGLSGVFAGVTALVGAAWAYFSIKEFKSQLTPELTNEKWNSVLFALEIKLFLIALFVLLVALFGGYYFTARKAKQTAQTIWSKSTRQLLINLFIPLVAGGMFAIAMYYHKAIGFIAPSMLIFYGLALVNSSKYTLNDIRYLGILEIILGIVALFFIGYGLYFWAFGFGILHIVYGISMYFKYEYKQ